MTFGATRDVLAKEVAISDDGLAFVEVMTEAASWDAETLLNFLEKPWKWADEFALWLEHGKPSEAGNFCELLEEAHL